MKLKQFAALLMCGALLAGCSGAPASQSTDAEPAGTDAVNAETPAADDAQEAALFTAGTYTASTTGRNGELTVTVEFSDSRIESITTDSVETQAIGVAAIDTLTAQILENQTLDVDAITGATVSCDAFLAAVKDTVQQAGADPAALTGAVVQDSVTYVTEADVVVVGAGGAGLTAALTASENGASVILLEKASNVGGNTLCALAGINAADSDIQLADETYLAKGTPEGLKSLQMNNDDVRENLVDAYVENSAEVVNWLAGLGVPFTVNIKEDQRNNEDTNYYMLTAGGNFETTPAMVNAVYNAIQQTDINVYLNTAATALVTDETGAVTGVIATGSDGSEVTFSAKAVILATGGFGQNGELVAEIRPDLKNAVPNEIAPTTGDGLLMAQAIGAATVNLDAIQTFPHVMDDYGLTMGNVMPGGMIPDAIYVNQDAQRFAAEGFMVPAVLDQEQSYCIFDESGLNETLEALVANGIVKSGTVEELAAEFGLDAEALAATIEAFNEDIADGVDDAFGREENLNPIEGTLYGYHFGVGVHYFMGGILINENAQVLTADETPIEGLYAAGEVTGGFHGTFRVDGSGIGEAFIFGRIAGRTAAAYAE